MKTNAVHIIQLLQNAYEYDPVGNITRIKNSGMNPYIHNYTYDDNYQLTHADGDWSSQIGYAMDADYSPSGKILTKNYGGDILDDQGTQGINIKNQYDYYSNKPQQLEHIYNGALGEDEYFGWDAKGNMIDQYNAKLDDRIRFCWTEDNRLQSFMDNKNSSYYGYDAQGERAYKLTGGIAQINQNGTNYNMPVLLNTTLYASPLVTISDKGYTKHYFEEGKRICSKIGGGELRDVYNNIGGITNPPEELRDMQYEGVNQGITSCLGGISPSINNFDLNKIVQQYEQKVDSYEPSFYYTSDHLGSSSYITDDQGQTTQTLAYLPYGEDWVNLTNPNAQYLSPYKYNGKEKDEETGLNYYGARYYTAAKSIWLSVDPMSDKYPHLTGYVYCANNPIMLIDPDGRDLDDPPYTYQFSGYLLGAFLENCFNHHKVKEVGYAMQNTNTAMDVKNRINSIASNFQINIGNAIGSKSRERGTPQNAIRHTLWQAMIAEQYGSNDAARVANAHENNIPSDLSKRKFGGMEEADQMVDLLNNEIGRSIGEKNKGASNKELAGKVMEEYKDKGLWTVSGNNRKGYVIQKSRITQEQYNAAIKEIGKKGENGLNQ